MKKSFIFSVLAIAALVSCSKEKAFQPESEPAAVQVFTATREALVDNNSKAAFEGMSLKWNEGDEIAIYDGTIASVFVATNVTEENVATFSLKAGQTPLATEGVTYKAYYPAEIAVDADGSYCQKCPQQQKTENGPTPEGKKINYAPNIQTYVPMYCESTTTELQFKNLTALVKISVTVPDGTNPALSQIIAETNTKGIFGEYTISDNKMVVNSTVENGYGRIATKNTNAKFVSAVNTYYIALPEGEYNDFEFIAQDNSRQTQFLSLKPSTTLSLERNKVYTLTFNVNDLRTDLSYARQTANCYPVAAAQKNMFRATKGNETSIIPDIASVGIVWRGQSASSTNLTNKVVKDDISYKNGYIYFESTANQGNAVIGAYDASGKILWSWHIWVLSSDRPLTDVKLDNKTFLDRNLGALYSGCYASGDYETAILAAGLLYQWGRKDPFGGKGAIQPEKSIVMLDKTNANCKTTTAGPVSVQTTIENPTSFITATSGHWASDITDTWGGDTKTIYDPCPYGYRVPAKADFESIWNSENVKAYESLYNSTVTVAHGYNCTVNGTASFFAMTGQLNNKTGDLTTSYIGSNSNTTSAAVQSNARMFTRDEDHSFIDATMTIAKSKAWANRANTIRISNSVNAYGMAVRCVKE